jgi:putative zinc finger/helix-turn-helix YgiT family protein
MSNVLGCPVCGAVALQEVVFSERRKVGRRTIEVFGLKKSECSACGTDFVSPTDHDGNAALVARFVARTQTGITRGLLRQLRETWGLTQREASKVFGAGEAAFAKWESGRELSTPSALLVQVALNVRGVMPYLARLAKVGLDPAGADRVKYVLEELTEWERVDPIRTCDSVVSTATRNAFLHPEVAASPWSSPDMDFAEWEDYLVSPVAGNDANFALAA